MFLVCVLSHDIYMPVLNLGLGGSLMKLPPDLIKYVG